MAEAAFDGAEAETTTPRDRPRRNRSSDATPLSPEHAAVVGLLSEQIDARLSGFENGMYSRINAVAEQGARTAGAVELLADAMRTLSDSDGKLRERVAVVEVAIGQSSTPPASTAIATERVAGRFIDALVSRPWLMVGVVAMSGIAAWAWVNGGGLQ